MAVLFQMVNNAPADNAIDVLNDFGRLQNGIRDGMQMVEHNHVRVNCEITRCACLMKRFAGHCFDRVRPKNWQSVSGDRSYVEGGSVRRDNVHEA
jgi:hypothetical protein